MKDYSGYIFSAYIVALVALLAIYLQARLSYKKHKKKNA